ncbi:MAG TPA: transglutaminase-like domain-containing protein, partial [Planctomycetota bacterium]|nr:transglutaminase-like domain-containing protein [Planctomycetota bacterium]
MTAPPGSNGLRRLLTMALWSAVAAALLQLHGPQLHGIWLVALTAPAAVLAAWSPGPAPRWRRVPFTAVLQLLLVLLALRLSGPLERPAALAGTILPPLGFVTVRRRDTDCALASFLAFCVLLVGAIIHGGADPWLIGLFVLGSALVLRLEARLALLSLTVPAPPAPLRRQLGGGLLLAVACGLCALAGVRALELLPAPSRANRGAGDAGAGQRRIGLGDQFALGGAGAPLNGSNERLLRVVAADHRPLPDDMYLRSGAFDLPGVDVWTASAVTLQRHDPTDGPWQLRTPVAGVPLRRLELQAFGRATGLLPLPPGTCTLRAPMAIVGDPQCEYFRPAPGNSVVTFAVTCQDLQLAVRTRTPDPLAALTALPPEFDRALLQRLLRQWAPGPLPAQELADQITRGLWSRCSYALREPTGPHGHALLDFLDGDRTGYCMHFAAAAAALLRLRSVPCRIGVGLYGGEPDSQQPDARTFGTQHAHAWVEIPFAGCGFVVFDPTPALQRGAALPLDPPEPPRTNTDASGPVTDRSAWSQAGSLLTSPWPCLLGLLATAIVAVRPGRPHRRRQRAIVPELRPARRWLLRILAELQQRGLGRG